MGLHCPMTTSPILPGQTLENPVTGERYDREAHAPLLSVGVQRLLLAPLVRSAPKPPSTAASASSA